MPEAEPLLRVRYNVTDLGTLGGAFSHATCISESGCVGGSSSLPSGATHAFLFDTAGMHDLGALGGNASYATGINGSGQVVGASSLGGINNFSAFVSARGAITDLGAQIPGASTGSADINERAQIIGRARYSDSTEQVILWDRADVEFLMTVPGLVGDSDINRVNVEAINDAGHIVGILTTADGVHTAFLYEFHRQQLRLINTQGRYSYAFGLNNLWQVVGEADLAGEAPHAFIWDGTGMLDLGTLGGPSSAAWGINDHGDVVGNSDLPNAKSQEEIRFHAFLWRHGTMYDLNDLLVDDTHIRLTGAHGINNAGLIVADGVVGGRTRACLLTPRSVEDNGLDRSSNLPNHHK